VKQQLLLVLQGWTRLQLLASLVHAAAGVLSSDSAGKNRGSRVHTPAGVTPGPQQHSSCLRLKLPPVLNWTQNTLGAVASLRSMHMLPHPPDLQHSRCGTNVLCRLHCSASTLLPQHPSTGRCGAQGQTPRWLAGRTRPVLPTGRSPCGPRLA
jgi:hypothetical protein